MKFFILMYEYVISSIIVFNYCFIFVYNQFHVCIVSLDMVKDVICIQSDIINNGRQRESLKHLLGDDVQY